ncbi:helix-turn-helix domain-containing protein [Erwinia mallotivora]|uniref:helix-turn-helix domain-containing protein n=1 Tax=Erwinia mallotivora TaxID=69222 RepID=UPI0021C0D37B|nr:helix-turn-helix domain-containing protein [Erwinia mallotivora]
MNSDSASRDICYSTANISLPHRFEYWNDVVLRHCIPSDGKPPAQGHFEGELAVREVGLVDICSLSSTLHHWERKAQHLRTGPEDDLWLGYIQDGFGELEQGGRKACLAATNLVLYDAAQTFRFSIGGRNNHLIRIPRHLLAGKVAGAETLTATVLDDARPGVIPLRQMIGQAVQSPLMIAQPDLARRYSQTLLDLLILSLEMQSADGQPGSADLYARMRNYISRNLSNPQLNVENIALAHYVSVRTVTRTFARHQLTPAAVIWQERLTASRDALADGKAASVSQVALDYGFSDFSHFSHAFRKAFGVTPNSLIASRRKVTVACR